MWRRTERRYDSGPQEVACAVVVWSVVVVLQMWMV